MAGNLPQLPATGVSYSDKTLERVLSAQGKEYINHRDPNNPKTPSVPFDNLPESDRLWLRAASNPYTFPDLGPNNPSAPPPEDPNAPSAPEGAARRRKSRKSRASRKGGRKTVKKVKKGGRRHRTSKKSCA
jgi:hypothetical protein